MEGIGISVSIVTDCDVKSKYEKNDDDKYCFDEKCKQFMEAIQKKEKLYSIGDVRVFVASKWTLEYCLALSYLKDEFHRAIYYAKKLRIAINIHLLKKIGEVEKSIEEDNKKWE